MNTITTDYRDHVITYDPESNLWNCDAFANRQGSPSLLLAQKRIDKIVDGEPAKPKFKKIGVWYRQYRDGWKKVQITSKAEDGVFISDNGKREKVRSYAFNQMVLANAHNDAVIERVKELERQQEMLAAQIEDQMKKLETYKP